MAPSRKLPALLVFLAVGLAACADPTPGTVEAAHARVVAVLSAGDGASLYSLLDPRLQGEIQALHESVQETVARVDTHYPRPAREGARRAVGAGLVEGVSGPGELFLRLRAEAAARPLSELQRFGAQAARVLREGELARLTTRAGELWSYRELGEGDWRWVPGEADRELVASALAKARSNAETVTRELARLRRAAVGVVREREAPPAAVAPPD